MWAEFQSLRQEIAIPHNPQGPQGSPYLIREDIYAILFEPKKMESVVYVDTRPPYPEVAMTFFIGRKDPMEEEVENMASSSSIPPPLVDKEMITRI